MAIWSRIFGLTLGTDWFGNKRQRTDIEWSCACRASKQKRRHLVDRDLAEQPADLVVTDLEMPNGDGLVLIKNIRAHPRLANIPILIVSSHASDEDHQLGLEAGADGYIVKTSFDEAGLLGAVSRLLGRSAETRPGRPSLLSATTPLNGEGSR